MRLGVIGPTGAGKSLLSQKLAKYYHATLIEEPVAKSPFLPIFYNNKETMALIAQNAFYSDLFLLFWKEKDNQNLVCDSTMFSNLVFVEIMQLQGIMNAKQAALTYMICDENLKRLPDLDLTVVLVRSNEQLFRNVKRRGRDIEQGQEEYLGFHNTNYYSSLRRIFKYYHVPDSKILWLTCEDMEDPKEFSQIVALIEAQYEESLR